MVAPLVLMKPLSHHVSISGRDHTSHQRIRAGKSNSLKRQGICDRDMTRDVLLGPQARQRGIFRMSEVKTLLSTHDSGRRDCSPRLWALICFELWMRQWVDRAPAARGAC